jgi:hypothetical protein
MASASLPFWLISHRRHRPTTGRSWCGRDRGSSIGTVISSANSFDRSLSLSSRRWCSGRRCQAAWPAVCQRGVVEVDALAGVDLGLAIQRQMIGILQLGNGGFRRQPTLDQPRWRRGLHDAILACAASVFRPDRDQHPEPRRHDIQPFALVFAAAADIVIDGGLNPRQMRRQRAAIGPPLPVPACRAAGITCSAFVASRAPACSTSSRPSSIWLRAASPLQVSARLRRRHRLTRGMPYDLRHI